MAAKKSAAKPATPAKPDPNVLQVREGLEGITKEMTESEIAARMTSRGYMGAHAMRAYSGFSKEMLTVTDVAAELRSNGDAVVAGDLGRVERMLMTQFMTLDTIFSNLAERSSRQEYMKQMETYLRLALKAQAQSRATAEALALLKNPQPYIRQANIAQGHQQVNNTYATASEHSGIPNLQNQPSSVISTQYAQARTGAEESSFVPNKLLDAEHAQRLDI